MIKLSSLRDKQFRIVEKQKIFLMISASIVVLALIVGTISMILGNSFFKLGMDFEGGYTISVKLGNRLNNDTYNQYLNEIKAIAEGLEDENGNPYGIVIGRNQMQGANDQASILIGYKAVASEEEMRDIINPALRKALVEGMFAEENEYSGSVTEGSSIGATISGELLSRALLAVVISSILMLIYIAIRFELISGFAAILTQLHDVLIMVSFMVIFRIEINSTFIAAIITILGYSINNTIIIYDRIRELSKSKSIKTFSPTLLANEAIQNTILRTINTTVTTITTILCIAILCTIAGIFSLSIFTFPLIIGLIAGTFSSVCISPSIWASVRSNDLVRLEQSRNRSNARS